MTTPILDLDEWQSGQAQPNTTVNASLRWLECFAQLAVLDRDLVAPPSSPSDGDRYIPNATATGAWAGHEDAIALYMGNTWVFKSAPPGARCYVEDEDIFIYWSSSTSGWIVEP
jgi:hypothetical protein